jgi:CubicO group peptidase (beta-lactamase class C family)
MGLEKALEELDGPDGLIEPILRAARVPGAAIAIVADGKTVFARGYGNRDLEAKLSLTERTLYPIASTTKALNATLIGMLVDEGRLAWDTPVQRYFPQFRLRDPLISTQVTLRDLLAMRTGLPRHDWVWTANPISRQELVERLQYLELSAGFRERFQYNNITATTAGYVAELVTGQRWEDLVQQRILTPLAMTATVIGRPTDGDVTLSYHENAQRELILSQRLAAEVTAPSGGAVYSTVEDMARWIAFNLAGGRRDGNRLIHAATLTEIHGPQVAARSDPSSPSPHAAYAMGWFVDTYNGRTRIGHGGDLHNVNSDVSLFPGDGIGIVSFINFGCPKLARLINQQVFDLIRGQEPLDGLEDRLAQYEKQIAENEKSSASVCRLEGTRPSHQLEHYTGAYVHRGYGEVRISRRSDELIFRRNDLVLPLEHWHYDTWVAKNTDLFSIHRPNPFDRSSRLLFETNANGDVEALSIRLEPAVDPIRFQKEPAAP